ncbi:MAG TPA: Crp/Fnr family transcriptional regulator [Bacteroidales bacterium]|nr:Crp/Fnr family transcriptional regulator [Bacteroidales bacterium]
MDNSYLGLNSMFGSRVNQFSYSAITDLKVCNIDVDVFVRFLKEKGDFSYEVLSYVCRESLINQFHLINQSNKRMYGRFADVLIYLSESIFEATSFDLHLTREELAGMVSISRENIGRAISRLKEEGIIRISGKKLEIVRMDTLQQISRQDNILC